jgi:hypothetical protein
LAGYTGFKDWTGKTLGRLTFQWPAGIRKKLYMWLCLCECGSIVTVSAKDVQMGNTRSCGCLRREKASARWLKHGLTGTLVYTMWKSSHQRAKRDGVPFEIQPADIIIPEFCPLLGIKLEAGNQVWHENSPSLDKIIPEKGYVRGNIQVISHRANWIKSNASLEELQAIVANWRKSCA